MEAESLSFRPRDIVRRLVERHEKRKLGRISQYVDREREFLYAGGKIKIPTSTRKMEYVNLVGRSGRDDYDEYIFNDQFEKSKWGVDSEILAGGQEYAFRPGAKVLELGSGKALALLKYFLRFPKTIFIGVDIGYKKRRKINLNKPGVQLTNGNWDNLSDIVPDNSIDTFISREGAMTHGLSSALIETITRKAKKGAILRYNVSYDEQGHEPSRALLEASGWKMRIAGNSVVAVLGTFTEVEKQVTAFFAAKSRQLP